MRELRSIQPPRAPIAISASIFARSRCVDRDRRIALPIAMRRSRSAARCVNRRDRDRANASIAIAIDASRRRSQCVDRRDRDRANALIAIAIDASRRRSRCTDRSDHDRADRDLSDRDLAFVCPDLMIFFWVLFMF